ncbi:transcriptional regulator, TetR family [Paenibacillus sophorae]|uniref:TetR/AcrR family transcriptional regulator n=1 Tax=Paenibacillus sophorae TaxID=1333845 RepID=A0A1H8FTM1_9BACL|nr:TetR/AcrR family transcriptional regulator [Paenibacillus sophorae]QWU13979.1 TetR/AcrR family transcriptional regulator [Paenibacillus sophorae]SEN35093.1 transcriptional regulator, TetR family [Paenibacillus sophorae]
MTKRQERQERERDEMRQAILDAAGLIAAEEGLERLSIRKIAKHIEYSPGIIYHYFAGKEAIIEQLLKHGYLEMVSDLNAVSAKETQPEFVFAQTMRRFIETSLADGVRYRDIMLNESPSVLSHTAVLFRGAASQREALSLLFRLLRSFGHLKEKDDDYLERTAQVIWSGAFGLILRLTVEKDLPVEQKERLISHYLDTTLIMVGHL